MKINKLFSEKIIGKPLKEKYIQKEQIVMKINKLFSEKIIGKPLKEKYIQKEQMLSSHSNDQDHYKANSAVANYGKGTSYGKTQKELTEENEIRELMFLVQSRGPVWYRGYFTDSDFNERDLDAILEFYNKKYIVVGHTNFNDINPRFNNKIIGVDAGIGFNQPGKILLYKNGSFYTSDITGIRTKL